MSYQHTQTCCVLPTSVFQTFSTSFRVDSQLKASLSFKKTWIKKQCCAVFVLWLWCSGLERTYWLKSPWSIHAPHSLPLFKSFTSNLCCSRYPDTGESTTPAFYQTKPQFSSYPIGAYCVLPVWVFCSQLNQSFRLISLPSYQSISSRFPLHCSAAPSYSSCHMDNLLRSFFHSGP